MQACLFLEMEQRTLMADWLPALPPAPTSMVRNTAQSLCHLDEFSGKHSKNRIHHVMNPTGAQHSSFG